MKLKIRMEEILPFFLFIIIFVIGQLGIGQNNLFTIYTPGGVNLQQDSIFLYKFENQLCSPRRITRVFSYAHLGDNGSPGDIFFDTDGTLLYLDGANGDVYALDTANGTLSYSFNFSIADDFLTGAVADYKGVLYTVGFFGGRIYSYDPQTQEHNVTEPLFPNHQAGYDMTFYNEKLCFTVRKVGELLHKFYCVDLSTLEKEFFFDLLIDSLHLNRMTGISTNADSCGTNFITFCPLGANPQINPGPWKIYQYYPKKDTLISYCDSLYPQKTAGAFGAAHRYEYLASMPQVEVDSAAYELHFPDPCRRDSGLLSIVAAGAIDSLLFAVDGEEFSRDSVRSISGAGWHEIYVKDSRSCFALDSFYFDPPPPLQWESLDVSPAQCETDSSGSLEATVSGLPPFQYALDGASFSVDSIFEGLSPGTYDLRVRDSLGCVLDTMVEVPALGGPDFSLGSQAEECERRNGRVWVMHDGDNSYAYRLNGDDFQPDSLFSDLSAGTYQISIIDSIDCVFSDSVEVERDILDFTYFESDTSCTYQQAYRDTTVYTDREGCDSVVIADRIPGDLITLLDTAYTCDSSTPYSDTFYIENPIACDSLQITYYDPAPSHDQSVTKDTCSTSEIPDRVDVLTNVFGCDSVIRTRYQVWPSDTVETIEEVCDPTATDTTWYMNQRGCDSVVIHRFEVSALSVDLGPDIWIQYWDSVRLQPQFRGDIVDYEWTPGQGLSDAGVPDPIARPQETMTYELEVRNALGCIAGDAFVIHVEEETAEEEDEINIYIPNIFSPNGDGLNDVFRPELGEGGHILERLQIFDRWGSRVYDCKGSDCAWRGNVRGTSASEGVYVYEMQFRMNDGRIRIETGDVTLVR